MGCLYKNDSFLSLPIETQYRVKLANYISTALTFVAAPYIFVFFNYSQVLSLTIIPIIGLFLLVRLLNAKGYFNASRLLLLFSTNLSATYYAASFGQEAGIHYLLFSYLIIPMVIFRFDEKLKIGAGILISIFCFLYLEISHYFSFTRLCNNFSVKELP